MKAGLLLFNILLTATGYARLLKHLIIYFTDAEGTEILHVYTDTMAIKTTKTTYAPLAYAYDFIFKYKLNLSTYENI